MKSSTNSYMLVKEAYEKLIGYSLTKQGLDFLKEDHEQTIQEQITITEIPAPPFKEQKRAEFLLSDFSI